ncbi:Histone-lysine N-methyltransferase [Nymphaea thermarum]|nr:Histone-lysine N-methyltransferase [Nymphaea thermarum]
MGACTEELAKSLSEQGLAISFTQEKGRCLIADRDFSPGEVVISQEPYASVVDTSCHGKTCDSCFSSNNSLKKCSICKMVWYCGTSCQKAEWNLHQLECQALVSLSKEKRKMLTPSIRLMVRILIRRKQQIEKVIVTTARDNYNLVEELVMHMSGVDEKQLLTFAQMANLVNVILPLEEISIKEIAQNFSRLACNAHTICDSELRPLGTGLYPVISIINHSCLPNSVLLFEGKLAVVRAVEPIIRGSEVVISYIETAASTTTRRKALKEQYLFNCMCIRCMKMDQKDDLEESAILEGYKCRDENCDGYLLLNPDTKLFICQSCGFPRNMQEITKLSSEVEEKLDSASKHISSGRSSEAVVKYKEVELLQAKLFHSMSIKLVRTRETLLKIHMELKDWEEALKYCRLTIPVYQRAYPPIHPLLGLQYYTCGKLEWFLGATLDALKSLTKAMDILRITHGANTSFMKELFHLVDEARAEANWLAASSNGT